MSWQAWAHAERSAIAGAGLARAPRDLDALGIRGRLDGRPVVSFASNDYLGLTAHPAVIEGARRALDRWGAGAGSARLIVGSRPVHSELEGALAAWKGTERAVLFSSGFAANLGVLTTFGDRPGATIFSDELNHASIVDGCRIARAPVRIYPHRDVAALRQMIAETENAVVVSDAVFSMDGDVAPVDDLLQVCNAHRALLVLDEAHSVLGPEVKANGADVIRVGTLSKFLGAGGGFAACDGPASDLLVNRARPYIFTTATPPAVAGAAVAALGVLRSDEGRALVSRLRALVDRIAPGHPSPIVPVVVGDPEAALRASAALLERGFLVPAIRPPSVPPGTSRLRVTVSAAHSEEEVDALAAALADLTEPARA